MFRAFVIISVTLLLNSTTLKAALVDDAEHVQRYFRHKDWYRFAKSFDGVLRYKGPVKARLLLKNCRGKDIYIIDTSEISFDFKGSGTAVFWGWLEGGYVGGQLGPPILFYSLDEALEVKYLGHSYGRLYTLQWNSKKGCRYMKEIELWQ